MTKQELLIELEEIAKVYNDYDVEMGHIKADEAIMRYINDPEIQSAWDKIDMWYS